MALDCSVTLSPLKMLLLLAGAEKSPPMVLESAPNKLPLLAGVKKTPPMVLESAPNKLPLLAGV